VDTPKPLKRLSERVASAVGHGLDGIHLSQGLPLDVLRKLQQALYPYAVYE